jgi:hypothetical protein
VASERDRAGLLPRPEVPGSKLEIGRRLKAELASVVDRTPHQVTGQFQRRRRQGCRHLVERVKKRRRKAGRSRSFMIRGPSAFFTPRQYTSTRWARWEWRTLRVTEISRFGGYAEVEQGPQADGHARQDTETPGAECPLSVSFGPAD